MVDQHENTHAGLDCPLRPLLRYFEYAHLPEALQDTSKKFYTLAWDLATSLPESPEVVAGLRKLLEAKDCFVRARLP